jgi:hypothetical protein
MKLRDAGEYFFLLERAALQDQTAEIAIEVAQEAEQTGQIGAARTMWGVVRRCRVEALKARAIAEALRRQSRGRLGSDR